MAPEKNNYNKALNRFVMGNHTKLSLLYGVQPELLTTYDLEAILNSSYGIELKKIHETKGEIDEEAIGELKLLPKSKRDVDEVSKAIAHKKLASSAKTPLHKAGERDNKFGKSFSEKIEHWRLEKMKQSFKRMVTATAQVEARTKTLIAFINYAIEYPSPNSRRNVSFAIKGLSGSLLTAHTSARSGAAWAMRSGFSSRSVSAAVSTLYLHRIGSMAKTYKKLDTFLAHTGIRSNISNDIVKRNKILTQELKLASADPELARGVSIASARRSELESKGLVYGR